MNIDLGKFQLGRYNKLGGAAIAAVLTELGVKVLPNGDFLVSPPQDVQTLLITVGAVGAFVYFPSNREKPKETLE